ncbi:MAG: cytochrome C peroxidase, partial [Myxococcales bacterium]|nr:cytochrome C peroxidase [Myxococcales bacterium]
CMGTNAVVEMDPRGTDPARLERRRWSVAAGPTGVAVDDSDGRAVVWSQFDRQLAVIDLLSKDSKHAVETLSAPRAQKAKLTAAEQKGRKLFHQTDDQRISRDGRACASCHPDGREDALTWSTPVGPRQTIMLAGRLAGTGPFSWLGAHESIEVHLNTTFQRLGGSGLAQGQGEDLQHLIAYIKKMDAPSHADALVDSRQAELVKHGEAIFYSADTKCADCHVGGATDAKTYDLGTRAVGDRDDRFDTPSLKFVAGTAPYFHDGRYASLLDVLMATDSKMGHSMHLSRRDALALEAYLETL